MYKTIICTNSGWLYN